MAIAQLDDVHRGTLQFGSLTVQRVSVAKTADRGARSVPSDRKNDPAR